MPSITYWSRIEPRSRSDDFRRSLQAQIRGPLWMLTRQWQFGEFQFVDAGSPIKGQMTVEHHPITHYQDRQGRTTPLDLEANLPLETRVERETVAMDVRTRVQAGLQFARLLHREGVANTLPIFLPAFPLSADGQFDGSIIDETTRRFLAGVAGRVVDGGALLRSVARGEDPAELVEDPAAEDAVRRAANGLVDWFRKTYSQPVDEGDGAWSPPHLEYQFAVSVGDPDTGGALLTASEYSEGHLDWYAFNIKGSLPRDSFERETVRVIPSQVEFRGMPSSRWWEFEEGLTDFGATDVHTTDLGRLLVMEFALIHGANWFVIPYDAPVGSIIRVASLIITDIFGQHTLIQPAGRVPRHDWQRWHMFAVSPTEPDATPEPFLFLPPTIGHLVEGPAIEEVVFMRDEMANMAWGVEKTLPNGLGEPVAGYDAYQESRRQRLATAAEEEGEPATQDEIQLRFRLASTVAENWIPLVPVHTGDNHRSIQLERAALLRQQRGEEPEAGEDIKILPRGRILNPGDEPYRINEEMVPRAPRLVTRSFQWTRWTDGSTHLWVGRRKRAGRGQGSSGLRFDIVERV